MISKVIEVSTAHLHPELDRNLTAAPTLRRELGFEALDYGWLLRVPEDPQLVSVSYSPEFSENYNLLVQFAREKGIRFFILDPDAGEDDRLPTYEWP